MTAQGGNKKKGAVPKVMSIALIELVEMTATLNVVVSINSTTVMQTYWTAPFQLAVENFPSIRIEWKIHVIVENFSPIRAKKNILPSRFFHPLEWKNLEWK